MLAPRSSPSIYEGSLTEASQTQHNMPKHYTLFERAPEIFDEEGSPSNEVAFAA